ncbi:MAG: hypothetical protein H6977_08805 [Gammaproteobacteria bacterium]|nr:hypothetical protein [Gammaproteobacteria bacterium]MCP5200101.1 hypothetical protein [Gammaproteobacteria bacterium]
MELLTLAAGSPLAHAGIGLVLGAVHACDADHVMTVTACTRRGAAPRTALGYGLRWSLGHGLAVMLSGVVLAALGLGFPQLLGTAAEVCVATLLAGLGLWLVAGALRGRSAGHTALHRRLAAARGSRGIVVLGVLHGLAGAAPVIALIPLAARLDPWFTGAYLLCFSLGVVVAMLTIATLLGGASIAARRCGAALERVLNAAVGAGALAVALRILLEVLHDVGAA